MEADCLESQMAKYIKRFIIHNLAHNFIDMYISGQEKVNNQNPISHCVFFNSLLNEGTVI